MARFLADTSKEFVHDLEASITSEERIDCYLDTLIGDNMEPLYTLDCVKMKLLKGYKLCPKCFQDSNLEGYRKLILTVL